MAPSYFRSMFHYHPLMNEFSRNRYCEYIQARFQSIHEIEDYEKIKFNVFFSDMARHTYSILILVLKIFYNVNICKCFGKLF